MPPVILGCVGLPRSSVLRSSVVALPRLVELAGTASDTPCADAGAAISSHQRLARVYVMIYRPSKNGRCRFVQRNGRLSRPASCSNPIEFLARGTRRWSLRQHVHLGPGSYVIAVDAVDALQHHQLPDRTAMVSARIH